MDSARHRTRRGKCCWLTTVIFSSAIILASVTAGRLLGVIAVLALIEVVEVLPYIGITTIESIAIRALGCLFFFRLATVIFTGAIIFASVAATIFFGILPILTLIEVIWILAFTGVTAVESIPAWTFIVACQ
jgi:hypothetical protein